MNKTFLIISYDFPPLNTGGSHRPARFATHLKEKYGLNPVVITVDHTLQSNANIDQTLSKTLPDDLVIHKTNIKPPDIISQLINSGYFFNTDSILYRWRNQLEKEFIKAIEKYKPAFILLSVPPFSLLNFVRKIAKKFDIPVIFDFRDPLSFWVSSPFASKLHYLNLKNTEKKCIAESFRFLVTSPETKEKYASLYPAFKEKIEVIFNSFDNYNKQATPKRKPLEKFIVGYFGSFYYNIDSEKLINKPWWRKKPYQYIQFTPFKQEWKYRSPYFFFKTIKHLIDNNPEYVDKIEIRFIGNKPLWFDNMVCEFKLQKQIKHYGFLSKDEVGKIQQECNAFLITSAKVNNGKDFFIAGKTYEFFSYQKPIIAFVTEGSQKWIIKNSGLGVICDPDNPEESSTKIKQLIDEKLEIKTNKDFVDGFLTGNQVEKLFNIIKPLI